VVDRHAAGDDGNARNNDGCNSTCAIETGLACTGTPSVCEKCGNGVIEGSEECDDSNTVMGDGCSSSCQLEGTVISVETEEDTIKSWSLGTAAYASVTNYDVFERQSNGSWTQASKLVASDGAAYENFGISVSVYEGRALVGAHGDDDKGGASGSAYIYSLLCGNGVVDSEALSECSTRSLIANPSYNQDGVLFFNGNIHCVNF
jgi:cysteine-rich repeat protein